jgi:F-type H+-transporting ATPase subunit gamma
MGQTTRQIQRQIKGVKNVKQITHAMEMVSAAKLKRVEQKLDAIRPYWNRVREIFGRLIDVLDAPESDLLKQREEVNRVGLIVIAGEKGLCGNYNDDIFGRTGEFLETFPDDVEKGFIAIGKKTKNWLRDRPYEVYETRTELPTEPSFELARGISELAEKRFRDGTFDEVHVVYTEFENALNQSPQTFQFLPVQPEELLDTDDEQEFEEEVEEYIFEPKPELLLDQFLPKYVNMLFYTILLESLTSEHGARMVAMRDATDNAEEKIDDLTHTYNQARQETITRELLDIVGAVNALEGEDR